MTDPYELLGVSRAATTDEIRAAFRRAARTHHPDQGGDRAMFEEIKEAEQILSDPDRRAHYDATGEIKPTSPDNALSEMIPIIINAINVVILTHAAQNVQPSNFNVVASAANIIRAEIKNIEDQRSPVDKHMALVSMTEARLKSKSGKTVLKDALAKLRSDLQEQLDLAAHFIKIRNDAIAMLDDHDFNFEELLRLNNATASTNTFFRMGGY